MLNYSLLDNLLEYRPKLVAVAVSGGADSMCLANLAQQWCIKNGAELIALIVDHGLREESGREAAYIKNLLHSHGIMGRVLVWEGVKPCSNVQNKARIARYSLLQEFCVAHGIEDLLVGHTLDDQAETVLMRLLRGSGVSGVRGIARFAKRGNLRVFRPLLEVNRPQVERHLRAAGWTWVEDPSNHSLKYDRVKVRAILRECAAAFGDDLVRRRLALFADNAYRTDSYLQTRVNKLWKRRIEISPLNYIRFSNSFYKLHMEMQLRMLTRMIKHFNLNAYPPRLDSLLLILETLSGPATSTKTLGGCQFVKTVRDTFVFPEVLESVRHLMLGQDYMHAGVRIVPKIDGLYMRALNKDGWAALKATGISKPKEVPVAIMHALMGVYCNKQLIAVPHVEYLHAAYEQALEFFPPN